MTLNPAAVKSPADYLRAFRRRIWLVLVVAVPLAVACSIWALRQPRIYQASAEVVIEPPKYDPILSTLVSREIGHDTNSTQESYIPNLTAMLRSKTLAQIVVDNPAFSADVTSFDDPAFELVLDHLQVRSALRSNRLTVSLEGKDPSRTRKLLEVLLTEFKNLAESGNRIRIQETKEFAAERKAELGKQLKTLEDEIINHLMANKTIGPSGRNIFEERFVEFSNMLAHKQMRVDEMNHQLFMARGFPKSEVNAEKSAREERIAALEEEKDQLTQMLHKFKATAKRYGSEPAVRECKERLAEVTEKLKACRSFKTQIASDPTAMFLENCNRELEEARVQNEANLAKMQESMPAHHKYLSMVEERNHIREAIAEMDQNIRSFAILAKSQKDSVTIPGSVVEPTVPIRPSRTMYIAMGTILSLALGVGLVMVLEHVDHSVRVPEHVTLGLTLPLLGVVPRIRRTALTHRAGHLWTAGTPDSLEADAFRNLRASLLGVSDRLGSLVTILVTSPKAGDGKSTAALNLAATCARAGERTLLLDVDLRRPSLGDVFPAEPNKPSTTLGLVDVLQGHVPWQKTLRHTELRNLDFIPTGDTREIPIEILGTLELRQLVTALANHYDRVILDGPAVLGMADCRMLGRMVDAAIMVVRAGAHQLVTLQRAKAMLEQSHVDIAGVVVNSLSDDVHNWSSYGYAVDSSWNASAGRRESTHRSGGALESSAHEESLAMAGSAAP